MDARNVLPGDEWISAGWEFAALGRKHTPVFDLTEGVLSLLESR
ncbi:hypothetical protein [Sinomonas terrae]|nr:hypothetical protein [Sinomonas terrae]